MSETKRTKSETARIVDAERAFTGCDFQTQDDILAGLRADPPCIASPIDAAEWRLRNLRTIQRECEALDADGRARLLRVLGSER